MPIFGSYLKKEFPQPQSLVLVETPTRGIRADGSRKSLLMVLELGGEDYSEALWDQVPAWDGNRIAYGCVDA